jgi:carbamoyl-phosphate synthase small subunit
MSEQFQKKASLILEDKSTFEGISFGHEASIAGEVVFSTGMVGYPEALTDPSFYGQILVLTFPLIGNYGVPSDEDPETLRDFFESRRIQASGLIVSDYSTAHSHWQAIQSLSHWLKKYDVPALMGVDTRAVTKRLREKGAMLGRIEFPGQPIDFYDPNTDQLIERVSIREPEIYGSGDKMVLLVDCGCKESISGNVSRRGVTVKRVPWNHDLQKEDYDGLMISSGPGDPKICNHVIHQIRHALRRDKPVMGICLGHQMMALAVGANTFKLKYGHRSQNQPVMDNLTQKCFVTSQNHGFAVDTATLPEDWVPWFTNLNDDTNEGIRHRTKPFMSVQFHPEAHPGPVDTEYLFDEFIELVKG